MTQLNRSGALDIFRLIAAFLVVAIHTAPLSSINDTADFALTRIIGRVAVPFFIMVTGYFLNKAIQNRENRYIKGSILKLSTIYGISILLFLPINIYTGEALTWAELVKDILFDGTFYHLWYLPAMIVAIPLVTFALQRFGLTISWVGSAIMYGVGLLGDSYYGLVEQADKLSTFYDFIFTISEYTRNGLFYVPIFLVLGVALAKSNRRLSRQQILIGLGISSSLLLIEGLVLHSLSWQRHDSMYILLVPCMYYLFLLLLQLPGIKSKALRNLALVIYLIHPAIIIVVRGFAEVINQEQLLIYNSFVHYLVVSCLSFLSAIVFLRISSRRKKQWDVAPDNRAWIEVNLPALKHNVQELSRLLPDQSELMAVVKANAYGHGDIAIARELMRSGVKSFAVATLKEGIHLRQKGIKGDILILGYTNPKYSSQLAKYKLIQTVVDYPYAQMLNQSSKPIRVHIKVDTGMNRLGVYAENLSEIERIFLCTNLKVDGIFSHLSASDSVAGENALFTEQQIQRFYQLTDSLKAKGYHLGKLHIQSSYGILNYPDLAYDYARAGIALYGVLSAHDQTHTSVHLKPVLSLKARIATIKEIEPGDTISYGRQFKATSNMKIATITIGYADGIPRMLNENSDAYVLIHAKKAPIIGRICMDQLIIDISHIKEAKPNDVVTLIGVDGEKQIQCEDIAQQNGTISNEILSRLGSRLEYVYLK